jgi:dihydrofolate reductase
LYRNADLLVMGRTHYQGAARYFSSADDDPYADVMNSARKVVFSHTLTTADWANTTVINGDLAAEIERLKLTWLTNSR